MPMPNDGFDSKDIVARWLTDHGIRWCPEQPFIGLKGDYDYLRFDLWLPDKYTCIEVDGQQHYQAKFNDSVEAFLKKRDYARRKQMYCLKYGIRLERVVYDELNYLDQTLAFLLEDGVPEHVQWKLLAANQSNQQ